MNRIITKVVGLAVASLLALGAATGLNAAAAQDASEGLAGKVVAVDRAKNKLTVNIQGNLFDFRMNPQMMVVENDQKATPDALAPGQAVRLMVSPDAKGRLEISWVAIGAGATPAQPTVPAKEPPKAPPPVQEPPKAAVPAENLAQPDMGTTSPTLPLAEAPSQKIPKRKDTKHEISVSGDFLIGQGNVTLPIAFSLRNTFPALNPLVVKPERDSEYIGLSLSYSLGQKWYLDLGYATGKSSGDVNLDLGKDNPSVQGKFSLDDDWYQAYIRHTFPGLKTKHFEAYLRGGIAFVQSDMKLESTLPPLGFYTQDNKTQDLMGNLGFGLFYFYRIGDRLRLGLQVEGEGFYGARSQDSLERLPKAERPGLLTSSAAIDNDLYGGIGRGTLRFEYRLGSEGLLRAFADAGVQARFTFVDYPGLGTYDELLWGPYVKVGLRYAF